MQLPYILLQAQLPFADPQSSPIDVINKIIAYAIIAAFVLSVAYVFFGGFRFIFSGGDEAKIKTATNTIRHAILGLLISIFAVVIVQLIGQLVGLNVVGEILNYDEIGRNISGLLDRFSGGGGGTSSVGSGASGVQYDFSRDF